MTKTLRKESFRNFRSSLQRWKIFGFALRRFCRVPGRQLQGLRLTHWQGRGVVVVSARFILWRFFLPIEAKKDQYD
jgi:hypothetical protein